jgi:hypothetical protein
MYVLHIIVELCSGAKNRNGRGESQKNSIDGNP